MMDGVKEEGKAQRERNEGGAGRGRAWSEGGSEGGQGAGRGEIKEWKQAHGVREGV